MASGRLCVLAALCSLIILTNFTGNTESVSCCLKYTNRPLPCRLLIGYTIQNINTSCDIHAIIFHLPGRFVCANPRMEWTHRGLRCADKNRRMRNHITQDRTSGHIKSA